MKYRNKLIFTTTYGKLLLLASIVLLLTCGTSPRVNASAPVSVSGPDASSGASYTITGINNSAQLSNLTPVEIVRGASQNTDPLLYYIINNNLRTVTVTIEDRNGTVSTKTLPVLWSFTSSETTVTDTTVCGEYTETGTIQIPDTSYVWGENVLSVLTLPVRVYDPAEPIEIVELEEVWNEFDTAFALEQNGSIEEFLNTAPLQSTWPCYDVSGNEYVCPVIYNTENVSTNTVGVYDITATFEAPLNCRFSDTLTVPTYSMPISVQASGQPKLDLSYISPNYEYILFPWITSGIDLNTVEVWMSENDGEWRTLELDDEAYVHPNMLDIYAWYLTEGSSYQIQVKYEGGRTGIVSFTYEWDTLSDREYIEGDRDGGDTDGNPPIEPPKDENTDVILPVEPPKDKNTDEVLPQEPSTDEDTDNESASTDDTASSPEQENIVTNEDDTSSATSVPTVTSVPDITPTLEGTSANRETPYLLGHELALMMKNLGAARFSAETIMLEIPDDAIESLELSDTDRLLVTILPLNHNGFSIDILKNDIAVTALSSLQISMPYQPAENTTPVLMDENGEKVASGDYEPSTGLVSYTIQETGTFYIVDEDIPLQKTFTDDTFTETELTTSGIDNDQSATKGIVIVATLIIACAVGVAILVYIRKRRT